MIKIDTTGKDCPIPLIEMKKALAQSDQGQQIEVVFTCPEAVQNLPNYALENGHKVLDFQKIGQGSWKLMIEK